MKKIFTIVLACMMLAATGCSGKGKELKMVTNAEFPPFEFVTDNGLVGRYTGIDVAIANEIAKEMKRDLVIDDVPFDSVLIQLATGQADFAAAGLSWREDRAESCDFSIPYFTATQYIIIDGGNTEIKGAADLDYARVGVVDGYTGQEICMEDLQLKNLENYKRPTDAVLALTQGRLDAVVLDSHTAAALVKRNPSLKIITDAAFENEEYVVAVKKGDKKMLETVNGVIERLLKEGKISEFVDKYTAETEID